MKRKPLNLLLFSFTGHYRPRILRTAVRLIALCLVGIHPARAQFSGGFFSQQSDKEKLMAEQIIGLNTYLGAITAGYHITGSGLNTAHELKGGTFRLHTDYFNSLMQVSPAVQQNPKGEAIAGLYQQLCNLFNTELKWQRQQKELTVSEMTYLQKVSASLQKAAGEDMNAANDVLTAGKLQLTDQQRLDRLDKLYVLMKDKAAFASSFTAKCRQLALTRLRAKADRETMRQLYGIQ